METSKAVQVFGALAQHNRLRAIELLHAAGSEGVAAGDLAKMLGIPHNTFSVHAKTLEAASLVFSERRSRSIIYRLNADALSEIGELITSFQTSR